MDAFRAYLATIHLQELIAETDQRRRAKLSERSQPRVPAWRRSLSSLLASAARSLDPSVEAERETRRSRDGGVGRAFAG